MLLATHTRFFEFNKFKFLRSLDEMKLKTA